MTIVADGTAYDLVLTEEQQTVVECDAPAVVVRAPAGTGKTEILARRAERFVHDASNGHARVLVITHTTRAAGEFRSRLRGRVGDSMGRIVAETVHGFAHSILNTHGSHVGLPVDFNVITRDEDRVELLAEYERCALSSYDAEPFRALDLARAKCNDHPQIKSWRGALDACGAVDFGEMITRATEVLRIPAIAQMQRVIFGLVIVDEAQNLTKQQYEFITDLVGRSEETGSPLVPVTLFGDPKQLVTGFAGGDSTLMNRFAQDFAAQEFTLMHNFRSSRRLASLEQVVSRKFSSGRFSTRHRPEQSAEGVLECHEFPNEASEGEFVADWPERLLDEGLPAEALVPGERYRVMPEDIAVLGRHSAALSATSEALSRRGCGAARVHSGDDFMATPLGFVALLLLRLRSPRHRMVSARALRREFQRPDLELAADVSDDANSGIADALRASADEHLDILVPLLHAAKPSEFMRMLGDCELPETARNEMLAGWPADLQLFTEAWTDFANTTPVAERSWTRFALHVDRSQSARDLGPGVRLLTVHKAQGREFRAVAMVAMNDGQFPDFRATSAERREDELQAFYVAVTRASRILLLTRARQRETRYGPRLTEPSPYLRFIRKARSKA